MAPRDDNNPLLYGVLEMPQRQPPPKPKYTGNILTSNTLVSSTVKQVPDFVAGTAMVPEGAFSIGNAARTAGTVESALEAESAVLRSQLNNRQIERTMAQQTKALGKTKGAGKTDPPVAIPEQYHQPFKFTKESYRKPTERTPEIDGYKYDAELSTEQEAVYHNAQEKTVHVSHRGSTTARDWMESDAQILTGTEDLGGRFAEAENKMIEVRNKYPDHVIEGSGHSLGGSIVHNNTSLFGESPWYGQHTTFNPGTSPFGRGGVQRIIEPHSSIKHGKVTNVRQAMDPISFSSRPYGETITVDTANDPIHAHKLDSFQQEALPSYNLKPARTAAKQIVSGPQGPLIANQRPIRPPVTATTPLYQPAPQTQYYPTSKTDLLPVAPKRYIGPHDFSTVRKSQTPAVRMRGFRFV
jgi:hypothetical protein